MAEFEYQFDGGFTARNWFQTYIRFTAHTIVYLICKTHAKYISRSLRDAHSYIDDKYMISNIFGIILTFQWLEILFEKFLPHGIKKILLQVIR